MPFLFFIHLIQRFCSCNLSSVEEKLCFKVKAQAIFSLCKNVSIGRLPINAFRITLYPQLKIRKTSFLRFVVQINNRMYIDLHYNYASEVGFRFNTFSLLFMRFTIHVHVENRILFFCVEAVESKLYLEPKNTYS